MFTISPTGYIRGSAQQVTAPLSTCTPVSTPTLRLETEYGQLGVDLVRRASGSGEEDLNAESRAKVVSTKHSLTWVGRASFSRLQFILLNEVSTGITQWALPPARDDTCHA